MLDDETRKVLHDLRDSMHSMKLEHVTHRLELSGEMGIIKGELKAVDEKLGQMVTRPEFTPVKLLAYGLAGTILSGAIGALLTQVFVHAPK